MFIYINYHKPLSFFRGGGGTSKDHKNIKINSLYQSKHVYPVLFKIISCVEKWRDIINVHVLSNLHVHQYMYTLTHNNYNMLAALRINCIIMILPVLLYLTQNLKNNKCFTPLN